MNKKKGGSIKCNWVKLEDVLADPLSANDPLIKPFIDSIKSLNNRNNQLSRIPTSVEKSKWFEAVKRSDIFNLQELLRFNTVSIDETDNDNMTALHYAVRLKNYGLVKFLLNVEIDCSVRDRFDDTALDMAKDLKLVKIIKMIQCHWIRHIIARNQKENMNLTFYFNANTNKEAVIMFFKMSMQGYKVKQVAADSFTCCIKMKTMTDRNNIMFHGLSAIESSFIGDEDICVFDELNKFIQTHKGTESTFNINYIKNNLGLETISNMIIEVVLDQLSVKWFVGKDFESVEELFEEQTKIVTIPTITKKEFFNRITVSERKFLKIFIRVCKKWGAKKIVVCGSSANPDKETYNDIDLIVVIEIIASSFVFNELGCQVEEVIVKEKVRELGVGNENNELVNDPFTFYMQQPVQKRIKIVKVTKCKHYKLSEYDIDIVIPKEFIKTEGQVVLWEKK